MGTKGGVSSGHDFFGSAHHLIQVLKGGLAGIGIEPAEGRDVLGWVSGIEYDGGGTNHGSRIERGSNATLGMVAHEQPAKLKPRVAHGLAGHRPLPDFSISILEVARAGSRTEAVSYTHLTLPTILLV